MNRRAKHVKAVRQKVCKNIWNISTWNKIETHTKKMMKKKKMFAKTIPQIIKDISIDTKQNKTCLLCFFFWRVHCSMRTAHVYPPMSLVQNWTVWNSTLHWQWIKVFHFHFIYGQSIMSSQCAMIMGPFSPIFCLWHAREWRSLTVTFQTSNKKALFWYCQWLL